MTTCLIVPELESRVATNEDVDEEHYRWLERADTPPMTKLGYCYYLPDRQLKEWLLERLVTAMQVSEVGSLCILPQC